MERDFARGRISVLRSGKLHARAQNGRTKTWSLDESDVFDKAERWLNERGCSAKKKATPEAGAVAGTTAPPTADLVDAAPSAAAAVSKAEPPTAAAGAEVTGLALARDEAADAIVAKSIAARASEIERLGVYWGFFEWLAWGWAERCQVCLLVASERTGGEAFGAHVHTFFNPHIAGAST